MSGPRNFEKHTALRGMHDSRREGWYESAADRAAAHNATLPSAQALLERVARLEAHPEYKPHDKLRAWCQGPPQDRRNAARFICSVEVRLGLRTLTAKTAARVAREKRQRAGQLARAGVSKGDFKAGQERYAAVSASRPLKPPGRS